MKQKRGQVERYKKERQGKIKKKKATLKQKTTEEKRRKGEEKEQYIRYVRKK